MGSLLASPARCKRELSRAVTEPTVEESNYRDTTSSLLTSPAWCQGQNNLEAAEREAAKNYLEAAEREAAKNNLEAAEREAAKNNLEAAECCWPALEVALLYFNYLGLTGCVRALI